MIIFFGFGFFFLKALFDVFRRLNEKESLMKLFYAVFLAGILVFSPFVRAGTAYDVKTTSDSVAFKNLTDDYMEMVVSIDGCVKKIFVGPKRSSNLPLEGLRPIVSIKSVTLIPVGELRVQAKRTQSQPQPQPVTDPKILSSLKPACLDYSQ